MSRLPHFLRFSCYFSNFFFFLQLEKKKNKQSSPELSGFVSKDLVICEVRICPADNSFALWLKLCLFLPFHDFPSPKGALLLTYAPAGLCLSPVSRRISCLLSSHNNFSKICINFAVNWVGSQAACSYWTTQKLKLWFVFGLSFLFLFSFLFLHTLTASVIPANKSRLCQGLNLNSVKMKLMYVYMN